MAMKTVEDPAQVAEILGNSEITSPYGETLTSVESDKVELDMTEEATVSDEVEDQPPQEEEQQRRTWQSEADKAKAEAERLRQEAENLKAERERERAMWQAMLNNQPQPTPQQVEEELPTPDLTDEYGNFDPKKFAKWNAQQQKANEDRAIQRIRQEEERKRLYAEANELIKIRPDLANPLTGQPDWDKIDREIKAKTSGMTLSQVLGDPQRIETDRSLEAIERNSKKATPAVNSQETQKEPKPVPNDVKTLHETFGFVDLPEDYVT